MIEGTTRDPITMNGYGFSNVTEVLLGKTAIRDFVTVSDGEIYFRLPPDFPAGIYDAIIIAKSGERSALSQAFTVYANQSAR